MKINKLLEVEKILSDLLTEQGHGLGYEINYNLHLISNAKKDFFERLEKYKDGQFERDSDDKVLTFVVGEDGEVLKKGSKEVIFLHEGESEGFEVQAELEEGQSLAKRFPKDKIKEVERELQKFRDEVFTLNFKRFNEKTLKEAFKNNKLEGRNLTPLFGLIIE